MLWLLPFICSAGICWLNRDRIAAAVAPPRAVARPMFGAGPFATSPFLLPRAAAGFGGTPYGVGPLLLSPAPAVAYANANAPAASPFAYASAPPESSPTAPIALLRCAADGCMIRPEPRPWDDATLGRMPGAFTAPKDFPVYVLSYGPVGWAHVRVNHPDEGSVEGWIETRSLTDALPAASPPPTSSATSATSATSTGAVVNGRNDAMARHQQFMQKRGPGRAAPPPPPPRRRAK